MYVKRKYRNQVSYLNIVHKWNRLAQQQAYDNLERNKRHSERPQKGFTK